MYQFMRLQKGNNMPAEIIGLGAEFDKPYKVEVGFWNEEEFIAFCKTLNNAIISYRDIINTIRFGCDIGSKWEPLAAREMEDLDKDFFLLCDVYTQFHNKEKEIS